MRAFLVGLLALIVMGIFMVLGFLLYPILLATTILFRLALGLLLVVLCIWLLGQSIIFVWRKIEHRRCCNPSHNISESKPGSNEERL